MGTSRGPQTKVECRTGRTRGLTCSVRPPRRHMRRHIWRQATQRVASVEWAFSFVSRFLHNILLFLPCTREAMDTDIMIAPSTHTGSHHVRDTSEIIVSFEGDTSARFRVSTWLEIMTHAPKSMLVTPMLLIAPLSIVWAVQCVNDDKDYLPALIDAVSSTPGVQSVHMLASRTACTTPPNVQLHPFVALCIHLASARALLVAPKVGEVQVRRARAASALLVSIPPSTCDILVMRFDVLHAMPDALVLRLCRTAFIVYYGGTDIEFVCRPSFRCVPQSALGGSGDFTQWQHDIVRFYQRIRCRPYQNSS